MRAGFGCDLNDAQLAKATAADSINGLTAQIAAGKATNGSARATSVGVAGAPASNPLGVQEPGAAAELPGRPGGGGPIPAGDATEISGEEADRIVADGLGGQINAEPAGVVLAPEREAAAIAAVQAHRNSYAKGVFVWDRSRPQGTYFQRRTQASFAAR